MCGFFEQIAYQMARNPPLRALPDCAGTIRDPVSRRVCLIA
jgi:hypothetical protein